MPSVSITYKYGIVPRGVWINFSHREACTLTKDIPREATKILNYLAIPSWAEKIIKNFLPVINIAREILKIILEIKVKNESSDKKGIKIFFNLSSLRITKVDRRGKRRKSLCS